MPPGSPRVRRREQQEVLAVVPLLAGHPESRRRRQFHLHRSVGRKGDCGQ